MSEQPGALLSFAVTSYMEGEANEYTTVAEEIRRNYSELVEAVKSHCETLEVSVDVWDSAANVAPGDLDAIRKFVDPMFMNSDSFNYFKARRSATPAWTTQQRSTALALIPRAEQVAGEWESDAFYLRRLGKMFGLGIDKGVEQGILGQSGGMGSVGSLTLGEMRSDPQAGAQWISKPYPHFVTADEKARFVAQMRAGWDSSGLGKFATDKAQWLQKIVEDYLRRLSDVNTYGEENFLTSTSGGTLMFPATATTLAKAEEIVKKMQPGTREFEDLYSALISTVPMQIEYPGGGAREKFCDLSPECLLAPLAPRFVAMREKFKELLKSHRNLAGKMAEDEKKKQTAEARSKLPGMLDQLKTRLQKGDELIKTSMEAKNSTDIKNAIDKLNDFRTRLTDEPYQTARSLHDVL